MVETGGNPMARDVTVTRFGKITRGFYLFGRHSATDFVL